MIYQSQDAVKNSDIDADDPNLRQKFSSLEDGEVRDEDDDEPNEMAYKNRISTEGVYTDPNGMQIIRQT